MPDLFFYLLTTASFLLHVSEKINVMGLEGRQDQHFIIFSNWCYCISWHGYCNKSQFPPAGYRHDCNYSINVEEEERACGFLYSIWCKGDFSTAYSEKVPWIFFPLNLFFLPTTLMQTWICEMTEFEDQPGLIRVNLITLKLLWCLFHFCSALLLQC